MKNRYIFIVLIFMFIRCSKDQKTINKLEGKWELITYSQTYIDGLSATIESTGEIVFSEYSSKEKTNSLYSRTQNFVIDGFQENITEEGSYSINDEGKGILFSILKSDGTYEPDLKLEVNTITSTDLKIVGVFDNINHTFIYKKKK